MLFGVGLGCLLQIIQNKNNVVMVCLTLYILYTMSYTCNWMDIICCKLLVSYIFQYRWVTVWSVFCCVVSWSQKGCCAGFSQEHWVCLSSSPSYWFLFSVFTWAESMAFFYWFSTLSSSSLPCSLNLELSNSDRNTNWTSAKYLDT